MEWAMTRPVLVKLGGSLVTDKATESTFQRPAARRLLAEVAKANVPTVLLHGAGSFGHPQAARHKLGQAKAKPDGVSEVQAAVGALAAQMVSLAHDAGLRPLHFPLHTAVRSEGGVLEDLPFESVAKAVEEGYTPMMHGTLVRDSGLAWRVLSADELMQEFAAELTPRLAVFATDVDGIFTEDPGKPGAKLLEKVGPDAAVGGSGGRGADVTGRMASKLARARAVATHCPTLVLNGQVRGRLLDALKGKPVPCSRVES
jgi:isopentenyl phosphate kinase